MYSAAQRAFPFYSNIQMMKDALGRFHTCIFLSNPQRGRRHLEQKAKKERVRNSSVLPQVFMKLLTERKSDTIQILSIRVNTTIEIKILQLQSTTITSSGVYFD
jgi:hypothetical protein